MNKKDILLMLFVMCVSTVQTAMAACPCGGCAALCEETCPAP
jgi:hypothetical protein